MDFSKEKVIQELQEDKEFVELVNQYNLNSTHFNSNFSMILSYKLKKEHCKNCPGINACTQEFSGCMPTLSYNGRMILDYVPCKYKEVVDQERESKNNLVTLCCNLENVGTDNLFPKLEERKLLYSCIKNITQKFFNNEYTKGLFISGPYGCGKSYVLGAMAKHFAANGKKVVFAYYPDLVREIKSNIGTNNYSRFVNTLKECDCLILDDFGGESMSTFIRDEILGAILQYRMDNELLTFITSNLSWEQMHDHLANINNVMDEVKASRIQERMKVLMDYLPLNGENYRK